MRHHFRFSEAQALGLIEQTKYNDKYTWYGQRQWSPKRIIGLLHKLGYIELSYIDNQFVCGKWTKLAGYKFNPSAEWLEKLLDSHNYKEIKPIRQKKSA